MRIWYSALLLLLADVSTSGVAETIPPWAAGTGVIVGALGGPVFAIWYAWYMTTNRIPAIERAHAEEMTAARRQHSEYVSMLIANYREDVKSIWATKREDELRVASLRREDDQKLTMAIDRLSEKIEANSCKFRPGEYNAPRQER